ncbi:hypothetical protein J7K93_06230 [bacterium]|nr:hypothetical protein [bacterium]
MRGKAGLLSLVFLVIGLDAFAGNGDLKQYRETFDLAGSDKYEIFIDVDAAEVSVAKYAGIKQVSVFMEYEDEIFRERVRFQPEKGRLKIILKSHKSIFKNKDTHARVEILLPSDVNLFVDARIKAGEINMDLGGISMKELTLRNWAGETSITFDEPNPVIMDFLDINVKVGEMSVENLGNARAKEIDINSGIGELIVDFSGDLVDGTRAKLDLDIGEVSITMPDNAGVKMKIGGFFKFLSAKDIDPDFYRRGAYYYSDDFESQKKKIYVKVTPGLGELSITR